MLPSEVNDNELLYRAITKQPQLWKADQNRPSSAVFKDSNGVSVDRDGERAEIKIIDFIKKRFDLRAIVKIGAAYCKDIETRVLAKPFEGNPYHAEIHNINKIELTASKAKKLAKNCLVVFFDG